MRYNYIGPVPDFIASSFNPAAEIDLFVVQEESFIKVANLLESLSPHDTKSTGDPIHGRRLGRIGPGTIGASKQSRA
jgi:hypothetical protein